MEHIPSLRIFVKIIYMAQTTTNTPNPYVTSSVISTTTMSPSQLKALSSGIMMSGVGISNAHISNYSIEFKSECPWEIRLLRLIINPLRYLLTGRMKW